MLTLAWSYCMGAAILSSPVVSAGVVYIASTNGILAAIDARSGHVLWQFRAGGSLYSTPSVQNGVVYIGALDGFVYAVDAVSGRLRWRSQVDSTGAKIWSSPAVSNGLVIIGAASTGGANGARWRELGRRCYKRLLINGLAPIQALAMGTIEANSNVHWRRSPGMHSRISFLWPRCSSD
jgi:outer membrane protein assembly factor BamB